MKRSLFGALAAAALLASPAVAQDATFKADAPGFNWFNSTGQFTADLGGIPAGIATGSSFDIFCVDYRGATGDLTTPYNVNITELETPGDYSETALGNAPQNLSNAAAYDRYFRAAWIIENWFFAGQPNPGLNNNWQWATWMLTSGVTDLAGCNAFAGANQCNNSFAILSAALAVNTNTAVLASTWWIITDDGQNCTPGDQRCQEFMFYDPSDPPQEIVPEPATMTLLATGLAGMAAANRRRRKQK